MVKKNQENLGASPCRVKCFFEGIQDLAPGLLHENQPLKCVSYAVS